MTTMSVEKVNDENTSIHTEAYYEELASQEELYLEETEEEVRAILTSYVSSASQNVRSIGIESCGLREPDLEVRGSMTDPKNNPRIAESLDEQIVDASEELITGDADDPPLSEEAVQEMLNDSPAGGSDL
jgi:hypothetical protein